MAERILGLICAHDEAHRYLASVLAHHARFLDQVFLYDDQSTDETTALASRFGKVVVRPDGVPSFMEHEGRFRQAAWRAFEEVVSPSPGVDWVFCFDADEFFVSIPQPERQALEETIALADLVGRQAVEFRVDEIFEQQGPRRRTDGYWGRITAVRLVRYQCDQRFLDRSLACGSVPGLPGPALNCVHAPMAIRHYGYARQEDREAKYQRYFGQAGHNPRHIASILDDPVLEDLR